MRTQWFVGAMCLCTSLGLASYSSDARADMVLDDFTVGGNNVDPGNDIPALRELTGDVSVNTSGTGHLVQSGLNKSGDAFYSFATIDLAANNIDGFGLDISTYSGEEVSVTLRLIDTASNIHDAGPYTFPGAGTYVATLDLFDGGAFSEIDFAQVLIDSSNLGSPNIEIDSVFFSQVPEPTSLVTALVGGIGFVGYCRRRRRRSR